MVPYTNLRSRFDLPLSSCDAIRRAQLKFSTRRLITWVKGKCCAHARINLVKQTLNAAYQNQKQQQQVKTSFYFFLSNSYIYLSFFVGFRCCFAIQKEKKKGHSCRRENNNYLYKQKRGLAYKLFSIIGCFSYFFASLFILLRYVYLFLTEHSISISCLYYTHSFDRLIGLVGQRTEEGLVPAAHTPALSWFLCGSPPSSLCSTQVGTPSLPALMTWPTISSVGSW